MTLVTRALSKLTFFNLREVVFFPLIFKDSVVVPMGEYDFPSKATLSGAAFALAPSFTMA